VAESRVAAVRIGWTGHLVRLVGRSEAAAARVAVAPAPERAELACSARREVARLSARLDASPLQDETADGVDRRERDGLPLVDLADLPAPAAGGWAGVLRVEGMPTQDIAAVEYANLLGTVDVEPEVAGMVLDRPVEALARLHEEICDGLVEPGLLGRLRRTERAVADGAQGWMLYRAPDHEALPELLAGLADWLTQDSAALPALVIAGVVQERLLEWQPFEAGNGRVAGAASRVLLRALGLDPDGLAVPERLLAADRKGYFAEVAATVRRGGDLTLWLERYGEALAAALEAAADALVPLPPPELPDRARVMAERLGADETLTVREYAEQAAVTLARARRDLELVAAAGLVEPEPRTHGLRYRRRTGV
jgi:Fic family protein